MTENRRRAIFSTDSAPFNTLLIEVADVKRPDQKDASKSSGSTGPVFRLRAQRRNDVSQEDGCFLIPADFELEQLVRQEEWRFRSLHLTGSGITEVKSRVISSDTTLPQRQPSQSGRS
jgi:hypothetical protein